MQNTSGYFINQNIKSPQHKLDNNYFLKSNISQKSNQKVQESSIQLNSSKNDLFSFKSQKMCQNLKDNMERKQLLDKYSQRANQPILKRSDISVKDEKKFKFVNDNNSHSSNQKMNQNMNIQYPEQQKKESDLLDHQNINQQICQQINQKYMKNIESNQIEQNNNQTNPSLNNTFVNNFTFTFKIKDNSVVNKQQDEQQNDKNIFNGIKSEQKQNDKDQLRNKYKSSKQVVKTEQNEIRNSQDIIIKKATKKQSSSDGVEFFKLRLQEKEVVIQQLQNYYSKLSENYDQSKSNLQQKVNELNGQIDQLKNQNQTLQDQKNTIQQQLNFQMNQNSSRNNIDSYQKTKNIISFSNAFNNSFKSGESSEMDFSDKQSIYFNQRESLLSSQNQVYKNSVSKHQHKQSEFQIDMKDKQINHIKRNQSATIGNEEGNEEMDEKQIVKRMGAFIKFYDSLMKIIKECNSNDYVVDMMIQQNDHKKGLKYIWKWIKRMMDDYMKMKTKIKIQQTKEINSNKEVQELFEQLNQTGIYDLGKFMKQQKDNSKMNGLYQFYHSLKLK